MASPRNPKDSMKSTWRKADRKEWNFDHWSIELFGMHQSDLDRAVPVHQKTEKIPYVAAWSTHRWILVHACLPLVLQHLYTSYTGRDFSGLQNMIFYAVAFNVIAIRHFHVLRRLGHQYGYLDGDVKPRDDVPDVGVGKALHPLLLTAFLRPVLSTFLAYKMSTSHVSGSWLLWLPLETGLYGIALDFWYYWLHRASHEVDSLWTYHRTHHLTKHPNALLTVYTDTVQEVVDTVGSPLFAYFTMKAIGLPLNFASWWLCMQYVLHAELAGHSGLRLHYVAPSPASWLLKLIDCELVLEDHDLHHRNGWRKSGNYGKQTRLWDRIFGTSQSRIESSAENVDWENPVAWPLF